MCGMRSASICVYVLQVDFAAPVGYVHPDPEPMHEDADGEEELVRKHSLEVIYPIHPIVPV